MHSRLSGLRISVHDRNLLMTTDEGGKYAGTWLSAECSTTSCYKQKSRTIHANNKPLLVNNVRILYIINYNFDFCSGSMKYMFWIICVSRLSAHTPRPHHVPCYTDLSSSMGTIMILNILHHAVHLPRWQKKPSSRHIKNLIFFHCLYFFQLCTFQYYNTR
jgi:hypothetical protein